MSRIKALYFVIFIINLYKSNAQISDKRLCADEECKVPISQAKTLIRYSSPDSRILSFAPNVDVTIYSKSAGSKEDLWGGEINGKRGYVPKSMVRETKMLKKPTILVDTEFSNDTEKQVPSQVKPDKVQEPYEVVDGTTIYLNPQGDISPSSTESPIQSTALPVETKTVTQPDGTKEQANKEATLPENLQVSDSQESDKLEQNGIPTIAETNTEQNKLNAIVSEESKVPEAVTDEIQDEAPDEEDIDAEDDDSDVADDVEDEADDDDEDSDESEDSLEAVHPIDVNVDTDNLGSDANQTDFNPGPEIKSEEDNISLKSEEHKEVNNENVPISEPAITVTEEVPQENKKIVGLDIQDSVDDVPAVTDSPSKETGLPSKENVEPNTEEGVNSTVDTTHNLGAEPETEAPLVEVTTLSPEIEVPQPYEDSFVEVTPNPLETTQQTEIPKETIQSLPPFGLFASSSSEQAQPETDEKNIQSENTVGEVTTEESILHQDSATEEVAATEDKIEQTTPEDSAVTEEFEQSEEKQDDVEKIEETTSSGFFAGVMSMFGSDSKQEEKPEEKEELTFDHRMSFKENHIEEDVLNTSTGEEPFCDATSCSELNEVPVESGGMDFFSFNSDIFIYLVTTAISVIIFLFGYMALDKSKREGPLIAKINKLEKEMLIVVKENQLLQEKLSSHSGYDTNNPVSNEVVENLKQDLVQITAIKTALEEQVQSLEKELENSTEVGMELNRMLSEILSSESGSDVLKANVEHLQRQLVEQQSTVNSVNETLAVTNTENHELRLELELSNKKVLDLQAELDKLLLNIFKIEEEKETQQTTLENEIANLRQKYDELSNKMKLKEGEYSSDIKQLRSQLDQSERKLELKSNEYNVLTESVKQLKSVKNSESTLQSLLEVGGIKAELQLLKSENQQLAEKLQEERELKTSYENRVRAVDEEVQQLRQKYDEADKLRVETQTKLEVLSNYFKDREAQWQKDISKHEALWAQKEGEATSTTERIQFMQEQLQNYKAQTESLKQEIMSQEIELKSQISVLEKKAHENWVSARQAERKLEESKQEAAQLRHRLTLRERAIQEDKSQHRLQSPIEQNGDIPVSPMESPASPPLLYGGRDHITKSPPIPGLPPFLPPPPGVPFMPPPMHGVPPFIPPPPNMFPGDHRPPPLGRMSSPPLNSRYSPSSRGYSPYDRNSSSPSDSEYGMSPPHRRGYSPFNNRSDRRDYKRPPPGRTNGRNLVKGGGSSGSGHSNESLEKINRQHSKV